MTRKYGLGDKTEASVVGTEGQSWSSSEETLCAGFLADGQEAGMPFKG